MLASERDRAEGNDLLAHFDVLVSMPSGIHECCSVAMFYEDRSDLSLQVHVLRSLKGSIVLRCSRFWKRGQDQKRLCFWNRPFPRRSGAV